KTKMAKTQKKKVVYAAYADLSRSRVRSIPSSASLRCRVLRHHCVLDPHRKDRGLQYHRTATDRLYRPHPRGQASHGSAHSHPENSLQPILGVAASERTIR